MSYSHERKVYIGDGAYMSRELDGSIVLTAENGIRATDTITLEPEVLESMLTYLRKWGLL